MESASSSFGHIIGDKEMSSNNITISTVLDADDIIFLDSRGYDSSDATLSHAQLIQMSMNSISTSSSLSLSLNDSGSNVINLFSISRYNDESFLANAIIDQTQEIISNPYVLILDSISDDSNLPGDSSFTSFLLTHELLHAVGLRHPGPDGYPYPDDRTGVDDTIYTVMSYGFEIPGEMSNSYGVPVTLMAFDIEALRFKYGTATNKNTGNTIYQLSDVGQRALDIDGTDGSTSIGRAFMSILDSAGTDRIQYTGSADAIINLNDATISDIQDPNVAEIIADLTPHVNFATMHALISREYIGDGFGSAATYQGGGFFSRILKEDGSPLEGGYSIARSTIIDHALSGSGDDLLIGNEQNNTLTAGSGNDTVHGGRGNDSIVAGVGDDILLGGENSDTIHGESGYDLIYGGDGNDYLYGGTDLGKIWGDMGDDRIEQSGGNSLIYGGEGKDTVIGSIFNDTIEGDGGFDVIYSSDGNDSVYAGLGSDYVHLGYGDDLAVLFDGNDTAFGDLGNDEIYGGLGNDFIDGSTGNDTILGGEGKDTVGGGEGSDSIYLGAGDDQGYAYEENHLGANQSTFVKPENVIFGQDGHDTLYGSNFQDSLYGGSGNDEIFGGSTLERPLFFEVSVIDFLSGGDGNDYIQGERGSQMFGDSGSDTLDSFGAVAYGGIGNDSIGAYGGSAYGGDGDDFIVSDQSSYISAGTGSDQIDIRPLNTSSPGSYQVYGGDGDDVINLYVHHDSIDVYGGAGHDHLYLHETIYGANLSSVPRSGIEVYTFKGGETFTYAELFG